MDLNGIGSMNAQAEQSVDGILRRLANQRPGEWLLFFDNADDVQLNLKKFFPPCTSGNILVTTRNRELRLYAVEGSDQSVTGMDEEDATNLLLRLSQTEQTDENRGLAVQIVQVFFRLFGLKSSEIRAQQQQELHHFALAVSQAGNFIRCHSSLSNFRKLYQRERDNLLQNEEVQGSDRAVYATWKLSYDKLDATTRCFLQVCSMLHHEGISEEMFERAALSELQLEDRELQDEVTRLLNLLGKQDSGWSSWKFHEVVKCLGSHSLIEFDQRNCTYGLHPLVQHWSATTMSENRDFMRKCVVSIIGLSIPRALTDEGYKYRRTVLKHIINATTTLNATEIELSIATGIARVYYEQGQWNKAEELDVVIMEKRKQLLGEDHPDTLCSMGNLANTYRNQGRWNDAEELEVVVMEKSKQILGEDHPHTLLSLANLAAIYSYQGRWNDAEELEVVVMEKRRRLLGEDHPNTLLSMGNLAVTYSNRGRWNDAEELSVVVMEKRRRLLGEDHPDTLCSMGNLAATYSYQGRWNDAEELEVVVMEKRKEILGEDHPLTILSIANLAIFRERSGSGIM